jgi:carbon storage regulator CsrA
MMLVVDLKLDESVQIGPDIRVQFIRQRPGGHIRIGIAAPAQVKIMRTEVLDRMTGAERRAAMEQCLCWKPSKDNRDMEFHPDRNCPVHGDSSEQQ